MHSGRGVTCKESDACVMLRGWSGIGTSPFAQLLKLVSEGQSSVSCR